MEELIRSLEGLKEEGSKGRGIPIEVNGVLAVHVRTVKVVDSNIDSSVVGLLKLRLEVSGHEKLFYLSGTSQEGWIICNKLKHFMVDLGGRKDDPLNTVCMELLIRSPLLPRSDHESVLGKATLHIHDIIHDSPVVAQCELKDDTGIVFAVVTADYVFTYGSYGFGESFQNAIIGYTSDVSKKAQIQHPIHKPEDYLHFTMFPRITPGDREDVNGLMTPRPTKHPSFIPFQQHATLSTQQESMEAQPTLPRMLINGMTRLQSLHGRLKTVKDRRQKLKFLEDTIIVAGGTEHSNANIGVTARTPRLKMEQGTA